MIGALRTPDDDRWYRWSIAVLVAGAWLALAVWGASPFAGLLDHGEIARGGTPLAVRLPAFVLGWVLMTTAMMLPGSLPLVNLFRRVVAPKPARGRLVVGLLAGYLGVWAGFGLLAYLGDTGLHALVNRFWSADAAAPWIAATVLAAAGIYQFTPLKQLCLDRCRSPYAFLVQHWRGRRAGRESLHLGLDHGLFCLGCCWTLMLVMFALSGMNVGWMLGLGAVMATERATSWGRHVTRPLGFALVVYAVLMLARGLLHPPMAGAG